MPAHLPEGARVVPLPATTEDMLARKTMKSMTLNDYVDQIHVLLYETNEKYREYLNATADDETVEGSLSADNFMAATLIRETAQRDRARYTVVAGKRLASIVRALGVVLRRYQMSRKERVNMIGGEQVPAIAE